jgi:LCP family protein required for cell wall assembly
MQDKHKQRRTSRSMDGFDNSRVRRALGQRARPIGDTTRQPSLVTPTPENQRSQMLATLQLPPDHAPGKSAQKKGVRPKHRWGWKKNARRAAIALAAVIILGGGWLGFKFYRNIAKITHNNNPFSIANSALNQVQLKSQGDWVNVLVAGYEPSDGDTTSDTIMVVSVNKKTNQAFMLSIPRDTWVNNLPGFGHQKINASNDITSFNQPGYPKGGMGELEQQIHDKLGITIDYYALINNAAFKDAVNAVGGIDVNIQSSNPKGLYDPNIDAALGGPLKMTNGWHHLDGLQALALVKSRGDSPYSYGFPRGDFDRTAHQRQVMIALKDKVKSSGVLSSPLKIGKLLDAVGNNLQTDIGLNDAQGFYNLTNKVSDASIKSLSLDSINGRQLLSAQIIGGLDVEAPTAGVDNFSQIQAAVQTLYSSNPVVKEAASVVVLNGSSTIGLATKESTALTAKGMVVSNTADAPSQQGTTTIIDNSQGKAPATLTELKTIFGNSIVTNATLTANYPSAQFIIILGANQTPPTTN